MWRSLCDWWLSQNSVTNVSIIYRLSICYSALFNSCFWAFKCEMWVLKFIVLGNATGLFKNHLKAIYLYLSTNIFFLNKLFLVVNSTYINFFWDILRLWKTVQLSDTLDTFNLYLRIWLDYTVTKLVFRTLKFHPFPVPLK